MDSANLSESQSTPLSFKSTASNTCPAFSCACCSLKHLAQTIPHAYCFRGQNPGQSRCKNLQDAEESFPMQQQFLSSFPFIPPIFCNGPVSNLCCTHNTTTNEQQKQTTKDSEKIPENVYSQKEKCNFKMNAPTMEEDAQKNNFSLGPGFQCMGSPFYFLNQQEPQFNCSYQRCGCGDSFPWSCSSFIVPMISYCVFWNTKKSNMNVITRCSQEMLCKQNKENDIKSELENPSKNENFATDINNNSTEGEGYEDCLEMNSVAKSEWDNEEKLVQQADEILKSFRSKTCITPCFVIENSFKGVEEAEGIVKQLESGSEGGCTAEVTGDEEEDEEDEDDEDTETCCSEDVGKTNECITEKDIGSLDLETREYLKAIESSLPSASESYSDLKKSEKNRTSGTESSASESEVNRSDIPAEEKNNRRGKSQRPGKQCRDANSIKKFINNFTMTDKTRRVHEEGQTVAAAAGDLGGINCVGYKVNIMEYDDDHPYKILQETEIPENFQSNELCPKVMSSQEEIIKDEYTEKIPESIQKPNRNFKSGIAKLLNNPKLKETKGDAVKKIKNEAKELRPREVSAIRRKHSCFPTEIDLAAVENNSKNQKTKNSRTVQPHIQGQEKKQKTMCNKNETIKKGEKITKGKSGKDGVKK